MFHYCQSLLYTSPKTMKFSYSGWTKVSEGGQWEGWRLFYELLFVVLIRIDGLILGFPLCFWKVKVYTCTCSILITDTTWLQPDRTEPNTGGKVVLLGFSNVRLSLLLFSLEAKTEDWALKVQNQENKGSDSAVARWKRWYWCLLINYWRSNVNPLLKINC